MISTAASEHSYLCYGDPCFELFGVLYMSFFWAVTTCCALLFLFGRASMSFGCVYIFRFDFFVMFCAWFLTPVIKITGADCLFCPRQFAFFTARKFSCPGMRFQRDWGSEVERYVGSKRFDKVDDVDSRKILTFCDIENRLSYCRIQPGESLCNVWYSLGSFAVFLPLCACSTP